LAAGVSVFFTPFGNYSELWIVLVGVSGEEGGIGEERYERKPVEEDETQESFCPKILLNFILFLTFFQEFVVSTNLTK
jgi:hypothetical protein